MSQTNARMLPASGKRARLRCGAAPTAAAACMQAKLKMRPPEVPGPGAYDGGDEYSLYGALTKQVASRNCQFGMSGPRFPERNQRCADGVLGPSELPGPHSYEPARAAPAGPPQMSSTFMSGTKRMQLPKPPTEPKASEFETEEEVLGVCPSMACHRRACIVAGSLCVCECMYMVVSVGMYARMYVSYVEKDRGHGTGACGNIAAPHTYVHVALQRSEDR